MSDFEKTFGVGRPLMHDLEDYWHAVSGIGELGAQWEDKPHRLVFDLIAALIYSSPSCDGYINFEDDEIADECLMCRRFTRTDYYRRMIDPDSMGDR